MTTALKARTTRFSNLQPPNNQAGVRHVKSPTRSLIESMKLGECITFPGSTHIDSNRFRSITQSVKQAKKYAKRTFLTRLMDHPETGERCVGVWRLR